MNVLYVSTLCSDNKFKEIFENSSIKPQQQAQKFHNLLSKGLMNSAKSLYIMSRPPINKSTDKNVMTSGFKEGYHNVTYHYLKIVEKPTLKHMKLFISGFNNTINWIYKNRKQEKVVICDVLNVSISVSALLASKLCGVKSVAIVTDIPDYMQNYTIRKKSSIRWIKSNLYRIICNFFMYRYDSYIILTEQMNDLANPFRRPYIVVEGMVDVNMKDISNALQNKYEERIIIYAGALYEKYGVRKLIEAFMKLTNKDIRLWLYGSGEMEKDIKKYEKVDHRIKYFGVVPNDVVVKEQLKATLLVNPRPSYEEFTNYSFPSKNMEYMVSGTPILTTPLQGMPKEYNDYVYLFEDETIEGMAKTLDDILGKSSQELHEKGTKAKEFVLKEKNNIIQSRRVIEMLKN